MIADVDEEPMKRASHFPWSIYPRGDHASPLLESSQHGETLITGPEPIRGTEITFHYDAKIRQSDKNPNL